MTEPKYDETRIQYLMRVLDAYMQKFGENTIEYDGCDCDGMCLADDIKNELYMLDVIEE